MQTIETAGCIVDLSTIPNQNMEGALRRYIEHGIEPGSFMRCVLENNLARAAIHADSMNQACLAKWGAWMYFNMPSGMWGSFEVVDDWIRQDRG